MIISADTNEDEIVEDCRDNEYSGNFDKNKLKTGAGDLKWNHKINQRYQGQFFQDCLHGRGRYSWSEGDDCILFKGNFYANKLEGYGKFYYNDCQVFEGLFKDSERFGPGVFTYKNGSQDVGMWIGKNLMRLCRVINGDWIPRIARTSTSKVKLLKHKKLIPIYNETLDKARNILEMLEVHEEVLKQSDKLYNIHIRNPNSNFFNSKLYEDRYFCEKDCYIEVALTPSEMKTYYEERDNPPPDKIITEEASEKKLCCEEEVPSDVFCVCENPKQVRINGIKLELERIENCMKKTERKIRIAKCRKRFAKKREKEIKKAKRLSWKTVGMQSAAGENEIGNFECKSTNALLSFSQIVIIEDDVDGELEDEYYIEDEYDVKDEYEEESTDEDCDNIISQDDAIDYETACHQLTAAKRSLEILFIKKLKLTDILNLEYSESEEEEESKCETQLTKRVLITDMLAWNNEDLSIDMMKHAFLHRNFENGVPFCVSDILCGNRSSFKDIGIYEENCGNFLTECSNGNCQEALNIFYKYDLNPDLSDSRGNTGIIYASARDNIKMIKLLVNLGANVDSMNDECFTSLGMCMLKYLAIQNKVTDWEKAFLKLTDSEINEEANNIQFEWRPHVSLVSLNTVQQLNENHSAENLENANRNRGSKHISRRLELLSEIFGSNLDLIHSNNFIESIMDINNRLSNIKSSYPDIQERFLHKLDVKEIQSYLFVTDCIKPPPEKKKKKKKEKKKKGKKGKKEKKKSDKSSKTSSKKSKKNKKPPTEVKKNSTPSLTIVELSPEEIILNNRLNCVFNTMVELLTRGASPNLCEVPQPTLLLSLFTKNLTLVEQLLINKANPNVTTLDENLSALHILVSVPPSIEITEILKLLLNYSANPNFKANTCHWPKEKQELIGKRQLIEEDQGKTPLHLLCMRYDFKLDTERYLNDMALILINNGFDLKELYLGHTPLSIAMLRGNIELIKTILDSQLINPNQRLGENMGFSLTLFILKRYSDKLPDFEICYDIIENLIKYNANPFKQTLNIGNVIEFMIKEHEPPPSTKSGGKKNKKGKSKPEKKKKDKKNKGKSKKGKKGKKKSTQEQVKEILISFTRSVLERHVKGWIVKYLFSFVQQENYYDEISETLAKFLKVDETIKIAQLLFNRGKLKKKESNYETLHDLVEMIINSNSNKVNDKIFPSSEVNIHKLIENFQFTRTRKEKGKLNLQEPETVKHNENYNVCYQCLRKQERQLFACPKCKLIYFCSQQCNKLNLKLKSSIHKCGTLFYKEQEVLYLATKRLQPLQFEPIATNLENLTFGPTEREIKQDKSKLLHLGRHAKKCESMTGFIFLSESDADLRKLLNDKFGIPRSKSKETPTKDFTSKTDRLTKKGKHYEIDKKGMRGYDYKGGVEFGNASHLKRSRSKSSKRTKSSENETDEDERKRTTFGASGKSNKSRKNKSDHDEDLEGNKDVNTKKDIRGKGKTVGYGKDEGESKDKNEKTKDKNEKTKDKNRGDNVNENKKSKSDKKEMNVKIMTKENLGEKSEKGYERAKNTFTNKENIIQQTGPFRNPEGKDKLDQLGLIGIENFEIMSGGKEVELKRRLPKQYQYFLEKISEYWPDFDISMLFLPYACYRDGQLYYRFLTKQPVFMETYTTA